MSEKWGKGRSRVASPKKTAAAESRERDGHKNREGKEEPKSPLLYKSSIFHLSSFLYSPPLSLFPPSSSPQPLPPRYISVVIRFSWILQWAWRMRPQKRTHQPKHFHTQFPVPLQSQGFVIYSHSSSFLCLFFCLCTCVCVCVCVCCIYRFMYVDVRPSYRDTRYPPWTEPWKRSRGGVSENIPSSQHCMSCPPFFLGCKPMQSEVKTKHI